MTHESIDHEADLERILQKAHEALNSLLSEEPSPSFSSGDFSRSSLPSDEESPPKSLGTFPFPASKFDSPSETSFESATADLPALSLQSSSDLRSPLASPASSAVFAPLPNSSNIPSQERVTSFFHDSDALHTPSDVDANTDENQAVSARISPQNSVDEPVFLRFELGRTFFSLDQIQKFQPGVILPLLNNKKGRVFIYQGTKRLATGTLMTASGKLVIRLDEFVENS